MLLKSAVAKGVANGTVTVAFRRWDRLRVSPGDSFRSVAGVIEIGAIEELEGEEVLAEVDARSAGAASLDGLLAELGKRPGAHLYRIELRWGGPDPRRALADRAEISDEERADLDRRLARLDSRSRSGPWTRQLLEAIAASPGAPSRELAAALDRRQDQLKRDVRKLKELGLTTSLGTGYELSPRGRAYL